jgi:thiol-disulfide isomerase/thioredoxin
MSRAPAPATMRLHVLLSLAVLTSGVSATALQPPNPIPEVRALIAGDDITGAERHLRAFLAEHGPTPQGLEALSWLGRGSLAADRLDDALSYAYETEQLAVEALASRRLDQEPHLAIALGAAIEVQGQALARQGQLATAIRVLERNLRTYGDTSIRTRISKNINLLTLEGRPAPAYETAEYVGAPPPAIDTLRGKAVLLFFWAHWCPDCKSMAPTLAALQQDFGADGLVLVAPTQRYGYVAGRAPADAPTEMRHIASVLAESYAGVEWTVPVSAESFSHYGSSTTPTIVLVDRAGVVTLYNPGRMTRDALEPHVRRALGLTDAGGERR